MTKTVGLNINKYGNKLWRLTKQLNDKDLRYTKITFIEDDTLNSWGKNCQPDNNIIPPSEQQPSNNTTTKITLVTTENLRKPGDMPLVMDSPIDTTTKITLVTTENLKKTSDMPLVMDSPMTQQQR